MIDFNVTSFIEQEKKILDRYKTNLGKPISYDGVVDPEFYFSEKTPLNLLFVLQTPNWRDKEQDEEWTDFKEWIKKDTNPTTWKTIALWTRRIFEEFGSAKLEAVNDRHFWLKHIAFMNINKCGIPAKWNNWNHLQDAITKCHLELREQVMLCKPDWIILCGTEVVSKGIFKDDITDADWKKANTCYWYVRLPIIKDNTIMISFFHPQMRLSPDFLACQLINTMKEALNVRN